MMLNTVEETAAFVKLSVLSAVTWLSEEVLTMGMVPTVSQDLTWRL